MSEAQRIPADAREEKKAKPAALSAEPAPPVFYLKAVDRRQREAMEYAMIEEGITRIDDEEMRELTIEETCRLYHLKGDDPKVQRIRDYWEALDSHIEDVAARQLEIEAAKDGEETPPDPLPPFEHEDTEHFVRFMKDLTEASAPIRKAGVNNVRYRREFPRFTNAHAITGWDGLETPTEFEKGVLTIDCVVAMEAELAEKFGENGRAAYTELSIETLKRVYLDKATEKNSNSPAPFPWTPQVMLGNGQASASGTSPASEPSDETPAA